MKHQIEPWAKASAPGSERSYKCMICEKLWGPQDAVDRDEECPGPQDPKANWDTTQRLGALQKHVCRSTYSPVGGASLPGFYPI